MYTTEQYILLNHHKNSAENAVFGYMALFGYTQPSEEKARLEISAVNPRDLCCKFFCLFNSSCSRGDI